jgi:hypothetical protein
VHSALVLNGRSAKLVGGLPSGPVLSGLSGTIMGIKNAEFDTVF